MYRYIKERKVKEILEKMVLQFNNIEESWMNFYLSIYDFKVLKTDYGYMDVLLSSGEVVKKSAIVKDKFNISTSLYSRITRLVDRFFVLDNNNSLICLRCDVKDFNRSNLLELLYLTDEQIAEGLSFGMISPTSSVSEIRKYVKTLKEDKNKIPSKDELMQVQENLKKSKSLNVHNHLTDTDLRRLSKGQIVLMYLELQQLYENKKG